MDKSLHVFVCSTYRDLVSERNAVADGLEGLSSQFSALTYSCPRSVQPLASAKEEIRRSDVLVLIVGNLQGVICPGLDIPHGEAEYNEGALLGKPILVYTRAATSGLFPSHFEREPARSAQLKAFREKLEKLHGAKIFTDIPSLVNQVSNDLFHMAQESGLHLKAGPKTTKFKAKSWETRRLPIVTAPTPTPSSSASASPSQPFPPHSGPEEFQTKTIPSFQKALSTPFQRRRSTILPGGKTLYLVLGLLAALGFALAKLGMLPFLKVSSQIEKSPSSPAVLGPAEIPVAALPESSVTKSDNGIGLSPSAPSASGSVAVTDDEDPMKALLRKAETGTREEKFHVGSLYEAGKGVRPSDPLAFRWYKKAADQGHPEAQYKVALMYRTGKGTTKSIYQAARWFQSAAELGHAQAQFKLGQLYRTGKGVERNETTAFKWFLKAADQNDPDAQKILSELKGN